eukprot:41807_1
MANSYASKTTEMNWKIKYQLRDTHDVVLTDDHYFHVKDIKECTVKEMKYLVKEICDEDEGLKGHKAAFIAWITENNVDGTEFVKYKKENAFCEAIMNVNQNHVMHKPSKELYKALNNYNFSALFNEKIEAEQERERIEKEMIAAQLQSTQRANALKAEQQKVVMLRKQIEKERKAANETHVFKHEMKEHEQDMKSYVITEYEAKNHRLHSEVKSLQEEKERLKKEILDLKENDKSCITNCLLM